MESLRSLIQSPSALFTFEAAARHLSFTKAAAELNVTQAAVSYGVKQLEKALGVHLFHRARRSIQLTDAGERFYNDVALGLAHIRRSAEALSRLRRDRHVTLSCSTAFAHYWMLPRLAAFRALNPQIDIRLQTTDKDVDLIEEGIALGIRRGSGSWAGYKAALLAKEKIYPVASPAYLARHGLPLGPEEIAGHALLHLEEPFRLRPSWRDWFASAGHPWTDSGEGLRLNDYALVIQAALAGQGIALGWYHIVAPLIDQGLLSRLDEPAFGEGQDFWVIWPAEGDQEEANAVRDWIIGAG